MRKLSELYDIDSDVLIKDIKINSKDIEEGDLFVCTMGVTADRHDFIDDAISRGASAVVVSKDVGGKSVPIIKVDNTNEELPFLCQRFYDYPDHKLCMIGVTGTDGKTTTSTIIQTLIGKDICGYIGTNGFSCGAFEYTDHDNTTPDANITYKFMDKFVESGCKYLSIETSSEAFLRGRLKSFEFDISVFTNITKEHLNIHKTFENYKECKSMLFKQTKKNGYCIINNDDEFADDFIKACNGEVLTYGKKEGSTLRIVDFKQNVKDTVITYDYLGKEIIIISPLLGEFNVYNLSGAILAVLSTGRSIEDIKKNLPYLKVSGRVEILDTKTPYYVMVDYAHTPNGIKNILSLANSLPVNKKVVVIGAAGTRDPYKRPFMGKAVCDNPNTYAIFTSEDPRSEDPMNIAHDLARDVDSSLYEIETDRRKAIEKGVNMLKDGDMLLILGKGNENDEILKDGPIHFNDMEEALRAVKLRETK